MKLYSWFKQHNNANKECKKEEDKDISKTDQSMWPTSRVNQQRKIFYPKFSANQIKPLVSFQIKDA